uniref:FCH domain-containing protein n=1 Tax=Timema tahoe TaxID=61484 RepID=A0A7R9IA63_9NEOP|nr:unnamed protein product [Timema tahoe]
MRPPKQDQYENLSLHTQKGIEFLEKYGHFIRDRCAIEMDYAGKLRGRQTVLIVHPFHGVSFHAPMR